MINTDLLQNRNVNDYLRWDGPRPCNKVVGCNSDARYIWTENFSRKWVIYKLGVISRNTNTFTVNLFISLATFFPPFAGENLLQQLFFSLKALSTPVLLLHTFNRLVCDQSLIVANTVYKEIFTPILFSPSLPAGEFRTGQIPMSYIIFL